MKKAAEAVRTATHRRAYSMLRLMLAFFLSTSAASLVAAPPEEVIVQFRDTAADWQAQRAVQRGALRVRKHLQTAPMSAPGRRHRGLTVAASDLGVAEALRRLRQDPAVLHAEPNYRYRIGATANDPFFTAGNQWGLYGSNTTPANVFGSGAAKAWQNGFVGTNTVFVAVIDEGIEIGHPDLRPNIWTNAFDLPDGMDNDGNGYADDLHGWDFKHETNQVYVTGADGHGTHVAGTIGARGGDNTGVAGLNWNVSLIAAKFIVDGEGSSVDAIEAIDYIVDLKQRHGLNIVAINASWGGQGYSRFLHEAVIRAARAGILLVAAAGNESLNNDTAQTYPANFATDVGTAGEAPASYNAVISVAAIDRHGALASFSNYGATRVHLGAPGVEILSAYPQSWAYMSGTSMAAPHVSGAAALYASTHPSASAAEIRAAILGSAIATPSLQGRTTTGGRLNLERIIDPPAPGVTASVELAAEAGRMVLRWEAVPEAQAYIVKRAFAEAGPFAVAASDLGTNEWIDTGVTHHQTYAYTVAARNISGQGADSPAVSTRAVTRPPEAPGALRAESGTNQVVLSWRAARSAAGYAIQRASSAGGPFADLGVIIETNRFADATASAGELFFYSVTALNTAGESSASPVAAARVLPPTPLADALLDLDGDGFTALEELHLGSNPANPLSGLRFFSTEESATEFRLRCGAVPGREYVVEHNDDFPSGPWHESGRFVAAQSSEAFADGLAPGAQRRIYRVRAADYFPAKPSEPAGFLRAPMLGNSDTLLSLPFFRPAAALGTVASVEPGRVRVNAGSSWAAGQWLQSGDQTNAHFLLIRSGARAGQWSTIIGNDADSVTLDLSGGTLEGVSEGDGVAIVPHWTFGSLFPGGRGVHAAPRAGQRTTEILFPKLDNDTINPSSASTFYFLNGVWRMVGAGLTNKNDQVIPPDRFVIVRHNTPSPTEVVLHGAVLASPFRMRIARVPGGSVDTQFALPNPAPVSFEDSGLVQSGAFRASISAGGRLDELHTYDNGAALKNKSALATYYYRFGGWRRVGLGMTDVGEERVLQPGTGYVIRAMAAPGPAEWLCPPAF